jgi:hypothetical protein
VPRQAISFGLLDHPIQLLFILLGLGIVIRTTVSTILLALLSQNFAPSLALKGEFQGFSHGQSRRMFIELINVSKGIVDMNPIRILIECGI